MTSPPPARSVPNTAKIGIDPGYAFSYQRRATIYRSMGRSKDAIVDLKRYLELETDPQLGKEAEALLKAIGG